MRTLADELFNELCEEFVTQVRLRKKKETTVNSITVNIMTKWSYKIFPMNKHWDYLGVQQAMDNREHSLTPLYSECHSEEKMVTDCINKQLITIWLYYYFVRLCYINIIWIIILKHQQSVMWIQATVYQSVQQLSLWIPWKQNKVQNTESICVRGEERGHGSASVTSQHLNMFTWTWTRTLNPRQLQECCSITK